MAANKLQRAVGDETRLAILLAIRELTRPVGPTTPEVAALVGLKRTRTRRVVQQLIDGGLLRQDDRGGALVFIHLTPRGQMALDAAAKGAP